MVTETKIIRLCDEIALLRETLQETILQHAKIVSAKSDYDRNMAIAEAEKYIRTQKHGGYE